MLTSIQFWDAGLVNSIIVNELTGTLRYPVERFVWHQETRGDDLPKMEEAGKYDRYSDIDGLPLLMEGHFLGDTTSQYWTIRKALMNILVPNNDHVYRYHSHVQIKLDGDTETYWANLILKDYDAPLEAFYPTVSPFQFQWEIMHGYWRQLSNNAIARI